MNMTLITKHNLSARFFAVITILSMLASAFPASFFGSLIAEAASPTYTSQPFTQSELDNNWEVDRAVPSGGYSSVSFDGRSDVLEMNIDSTNADSRGGFYLTEGLKRALPDGTTAIKADLYVDSDWSTKDVRAGLWGVGIDETDTISAYPIIEFTTAGESGYTGWRIFDDLNSGWMQIPSATITYDSWMTLELQFNPATTQFDVYIDGVLVGNNVAAGSVEFSDIILNSYNYNTGDANDDYAARWSNFMYGEIPPKPETEIDIYGSTYDALTDPTGTGWFFNPAPPFTAPFEFNDDEAVIGDGAFFGGPISSDGQSKIIANLQSFTDVATFESFSYDFNIASNAASDENEFYLNVYANFGSTDPNNFYDCRYDVVPSTGTVGGFETVTFAADATVTTVTTSDSSPHTCPSTIGEMEVIDPGSVIRAFTLNIGDTGTQDTGVSGYFDNVVLEPLTELTVYDFEPANKKVGPVLECVADLGDGVYEARFGVDNKNEVAVDIPFGDNNKFTGGGVNGFDQGQGTDFAPGRSVNTVQVLFDGSNLVWTLKNPDGGKGGTATANANSKECPKPKTGDLRVCKLLVDRNGNLTEGAALSGDFSVDITGPEGFNETVTFSPALDLNTDLVSDNGETNDAQCVIFEDVAVGTYEYSTESITSEYSWETPLYHDFFTKTPDSLDDFGEFTVDGSEDDNDDTDGVINLGKNKTRTLAIVNTQTPVCAIGTNLLENGSFEEPVVTNNSLWQKFSSVAGWVIEKVSDNTPTTLEIHRGWEENTAADGWQYTELDGDHSTAISQSFATEPGATYELKWSFAARHNIAAEQNQLQVLVNGVSAGTNGPSTGSAGLTPGDWTKDTVSFIATEEETTITFLDSGPSNSFGTFLDDAAVCFVSEPKLEATLEITNPAEDDEILSAAPFTFTAEYFDDDTTVDTINWAIKPGSCEENTPEINLLGFGTDGYSPAPYNSVTGEITIDTDMSDFEDGDYCLVVNPAETGGETDTERAIRLFTIETPALTCEIVSDTMTVIEETNMLAVETYDGNNSWTASIPGATWIWDTFLVTEPTTDQTNTFVETFIVDDKDAVEEAILTVAADNGYKVTLNGFEIEDRSDQEVNFRAHTVKDFDVAANLVDGENRLEIEVTNFAGSNNPQSNPAGVLYNLTITAPTACERTTSPVDEEPPVVTVVSPGDGVEVTTDFDITVNATDDFGIRQLVINLYDTTGAFMAPCLNSDGASVLDFTDSCTVDISGLTPGTYSFKTNARDTSDNLSNTVTQTFVILEQGDDDDQGGDENGDDNQDDSQDDGLDDGDESFQTFRASGGGYGRGDDDDDDEQLETADLQEAVLGAATSRCPLLVDYMQMGADNDRMEVMKLQSFLNIFRNMFGGTENPVTGTFGAITDANVKAFQETFRDEILDPWFEQGIVPHNRPTGFVYKTTLWKINDIVCGAEFPSLEGETLEENVDLDVTGVRD
jgi:hypothetical protein